MFYELKHPLSADYFKAEQGEDFSFPAHMHHCFELLCVVSGEMEVDIDQASYTLCEGEALLIFPNQIHSMRTAENKHSKHILCLFSVRLVSAFGEQITAKLPVNNKFSPDSFYIDQITRVSDSVIELKGLLYSICGIFERTAQYRSTEERPPMLLYTVFRFVEDNYNKTCDLHELSRHVGYDYAYISRYFKRNVGISYSEYVNQYRISEACYLLRNREMTMLDISDECGFNTVRSFNRQFRQQLGVSPAQYRRQSKAGQ